ncbi:MAG: YgfZ/GcvT domain-containing protein [Mycobacteriales bacterium]
MPDTPIAPTIPSSTSVVAVAVAGMGRDGSVAAHYGDLFGEQRRLVERVGVVDRSNRELVTVTGEDRLSWLHTLTTQHTAALPSGTGTEALILTPQGRLAHHVLVTEDGTTTWLDTEPGAAAPLVAFLRRMRFLLRVEPRDVSPEWAMLSVLGPDAHGLLVTAGLVSDYTGFGAVDPHATTWPVRPFPGGGWLRRVPWPTPHAFDLLVPQEQLIPLKQQLHELGGAPCGVDAYEVLRVAARRPRLGKETDDRTMPHEVSWVSSAVSLNKGCYPGQEAVAKIHNLGQPPRRLVLVHFDGTSDQLPATGEPVLREGREVGFVGTAVRHYELGNVALAVLKRGTADDAELEIAGARAVIDSDADSGAAVASVPGGAGAGRRAVAEFTARRRSAQ